MIKKTISLNGIWCADFLSEMPYSQTVVPAVCLESDSVTAVPVPGYWEDMQALFQTTQLHKKLKINPLYSDKHYPQTGYCKDLFLPNPVGCLAYTRCFVLEDIPQNAQLYIGGVQNTVSAWINGVYLGCHKGYSTPFAFGVPEGTLTAGENHITLAVSNNRLQGYMDRPVSGLTSRAANECTGGIYGDVELRSYPNGLQDLWVTVDKTCQSFTVYTQGAIDHKKTVTVSKDGKTVWKAEIPAGKESVTADAAGFARWTPEIPNLYQVTVCTENQSLSGAFGVRRLTAKGTSLLLNGEPFYFRGICEHCYQYETVHPTRDKGYYVSVIRKLKSLGFNAIRFHTWIPPYEYMEAANELGMLLEVEAPNNTAIEEWKDIVRFCRHYTSVNLYSTGNELQIDNDYEVHLRACADLIHTETDSLFSPMSAMRGIEYMLTEQDPRVYTPFEYNPQRLSRVGEYSDLYNSYSLGLTSYDSSLGTQPVLDQHNAVYGKPLLSHEICIQGTYIDLSLEEKYKDTRIGKTQFMSSVRTHLAEQGLLDKADTYYRNSSKWQSLLRKHCFETVRRCESFAGYDFLGDIDTHWHTFGYCVGMMNEFYELKPGETTENVLSYNSATVLLADIPRVNLEMGEEVEIPVWVSHYGDDTANATLHICLSENGKTIAEKDVTAQQLNRGDLKELCRFRFRVPESENAAQLVLSAELSGGCRNSWELYAFPKTDSCQDSCSDTVICNDCDLDTLAAYMEQGKKVVIFGTEPFASEPVTFQLSIAGRTTGHLATVIAEHPITDSFPHSGFCGKQFEGMLNGGRAAILTGAPDPHAPIMDIATSYKNAQKEALLFEYAVENGRLLVCTLNLEETDPAASWLKACILSYVKSDAFAPPVHITAAQLRKICSARQAAGETDSNRAVNKNDITA